MCFSASMVHRPCLPCCEVLRLRRLCRSGGLSKSASPLEPEIAGVSWVDWVVSWVSLL